MLKLLKLSSYLIVFSLLTSCSIIPKANYIPISYFDFGRPAQIKTLPITLNIKDFMNITPTRKQMVYRKNGVTLQPDAYNQWGAPPHLLITQYLENAIIGNNGKTQVELTGTLVSFDIDLDKNECRMVVKYNIIEKKTFSKPVQSFTRLYKQPFATEKPQQFAKAFESIMRDLSNDIIDDINASIK